jgi:delta24-sterol reductase
VALAYHPVSSISEAQTEISQATSDASVDYWAGIMSAQDRGVICVGRLTNGVKAGIKAQGFSGTMDPWFYMHAELLRKGTTPITEAPPIADYLFGYYSGGVWVARYACKSFIMPFNQITR